jgi:serine/threonine protein kinase
MNSSWNVTSQSDVLGARPGEVVLDRYELFEPCGFGGTASVWRAWVLGSEHEVAVKVQTLGPRTGAHRPERLEREYQILQQIQSPHVVSVCDFGYLPDGRAVLVFEFLNGQTLGDLLEERPSLPLMESLQIAAQLLRALASVHAVGVVHRDVKPENIMLLRHPNGGPRRLKLFDFGIAKITQRSGELAKAYEGDELASLFRSLTSAEMTVGTPEYMAPEQISATDLGPFTDVYAVGIVLHEMMFGEVPYSGETFFEIAHRHLSGVLPPLPADLPEVIHGLLWKALARRHQDRYRDAEEMLAAVESAMRHPEVLLYEDGSSVEPLEMDALGVLSLSGELSYQRTPSSLQALSASGDEVTPWGSKLEEAPRTDAPWSVQDPRVMDVPAPPWSEAPLARSSTPLSLALSEEALLRPPSSEEVVEEAPPVVEGGAWGRHGTTRWGKNFLDNS